MARGVRAYWRRKRLKCFELRIVRVVAVDTKQVLFVPVPVPGSLAVNPNLPIAEFVAMTLTAQPV